MTKNNYSKFPGFIRPTTTPVPDELFDDLMHQLSGAELKVVLYICRRTFGFKKDTDSISLSQMVNGITKKNGDILDKGTGLGKASVARATNSLEEKGVIVRNRNRSRAKGDEATTYTLNVLPVSQNETRGGTILGHPRVSKRDTQQTVIQDTEDNNIDVVLAQLTNFGLSTTIAKRLGRNYPEEYITDKLGLAQWLVDQGSPLVRKNPAGWLKTAIEDDFQPPKDYESPSVRKAKTEEQAKRAAAEAEKRKQAEIEYRQDQEEIRRRVREKHPPESIGNDGLTTESAWTRTLDSMQEQLPRATFQTWLKNTMLASVEGNMANVVVPNQYTADWIDRRMYQSLKRTFTDIIGQDVDFRFVIAADPPG